MNHDELLADLVNAKLDTDGIRPCPLCAYINTLPAGLLRDTFRDAAGGTIGEKKLEAILQKHQARDPKTNKPVGRRTISRHRKEEHQP